MKRVALVAIVEQLDEAICSGAAQWGIVQIVVRYLGVGAAADKKHAATHGWFPSLENLAHAEEAAELEAARLRKAEERKRKPQLLFDLDVPSDVY
jgi:hypothetical protein